ncbi:beta-N-acetylhexosaminidase [Streptomyces sp. SL54]|uniref:beta-N-acetylhexosaminidase n=1 Tax=Streptantibioticus silvisoli TaxID=2705255 RepID=A0ABT6W4X9_9ACTN|nr:beta-N-acetylhexosaminidase [Streptantibioticus silvisoli]MDI5965329.1 beta-N-acetylhexosaminidase [Streptantibioticus silvisoli]
MRRQQAWPVPGNAARTDRGPLRRWRGACALLVLAATGLTLTPATATPPATTPRSTVSHLPADASSTVSHSPGAPADASPGNPGAPAGTPAPASPRPLASVIPAPLSVRPGGAPYVLSRDAVIGVPLDVPGAAGVGTYLAGLLRPSTGFALPVVPGGDGSGITLRLEGGGGDGGAAQGGPGAGNGLGGEGYRLTVRPAGVVISAAAPAGLFHGVQTLRQLLPAAVEAHSPQAGPWTVAGGTITDRPRYAYRGAMLDVARHFFGVGRVERYIDELALYKVDYLHLHLTDDQGWRIAIRSWPRLAAYGGTTEVGGGTGGYYTRAQYEQIVRYARSRFMTVVPEIDMPAHTNAALASYASLDCDGVAPALYTGVNVGFSSLCVGDDVTYTFARDVLREIAALTPGPYLHIGGDEAHSTSAADYRAFMDKVQPLVTDTGKTVMAWNQITGADPVKGAIAQYWGTSGTEPAVIAAARAGTRFVLSPANHTYLDMKYDARTRLGLAWAGYVEVKDAYDWDPATYLRGAPAGAVMGVEAPLWSETLTKDADIDLMAFPRLPAVAELGWSAAASHDWDAFAARLAAQGPRWQAMGIDWYRSPQVPWDTA